MEVFISLTTRLSMRDQVSVACLAHKYSLALHSTIVVFDYCKTLRHDITALAKLSASVLPLHCDKQAREHMHT